MNMNITRRHMLLGAILLLTLWLSWQNYHQDAEKIVLVKQMTNKHMDTVTESFTLTPRQFTRSVANLFVATSNHRSRHAMVSTPELAITQTPQAPPLPFKYIGRWKDTQGSHFFIDVAGEVVAIKTGQMLTPEYRVIEVKDKLDKAEIVFLYLPLNEKQTMQIGKNKS